MAHIRFAVATEGSLLERLAAKGRSCPLDRRQLAVLEVTTGSMPKSSGFEWPHASLKPREYVQRATELLNKPLLDESGRIVHSL